MGDSIFALSSDNEKLLYAPKIQLDKVAPFRQLQFQQADTLILGAYFPFESTQNISRKKEKESLVNKIEELIEKKVTPILVCDEYATSTEIIELLHHKQFECYAHPKIHKINQYYKTLGYDIGPFNKFSKPNSGNSVLLVPNNRSIRVDFSDINYEIIHVASIPDESFKLDKLGEVNSQFYLFNCTIGRSLKDFITKVNAKKIYFHGPYAKEYSDALNIRSTSTDTLFPDHLPSLF